MQKQIKELEEMVAEAYQLAGWAVSNISPIPEKDKVRLLDLLAYDIQDRLEILRKQAERPDYAGGVGTFNHMKNEKKPTSPAPYGSGAVKSAEEAHNAGPSDPACLYPSQQGDACIAESAPAPTGPLEYGIGPAMAVLPEIRRENAEKASEIPVLERSYVYMGVEFNEAQWKIVFDLLESKTPSEPVSSELSQNSASNDAGKWDKSVAQQPVGSTELDNAGMVAVLNRYAEFKGGQKTAADMLGITPQYLCDILQGRRDVSETVAGKLGYDREVVYRLHGATREREIGDLGWTHEKPWPVLGLTESQGMIYERGWDEAMKYARLKLKEQGGWE